MVEVKNLEYFYGENKILDGINLTFKKGEFVGITGKNGSGKSTFAKLLAGLYESKGIYIKGKELTENSIKKIRENLSMVFQNPNNQLISNKVIDDMAFGLENLGVARPTMIKKIYETSKKLEIEKLLNKNPQNLSGGQKQIVAIAGILLFNPEIIILDEITSMLDMNSKKKVFNLIQMLKKTHTIIMISHDSKELSKTDRLIIFDKGKVLIDDKPSNVFRNNDILEKYSLEKPFEYELEEVLGENYADKYEKFII